MKKEARQIKVKRNNSLPPKSLQQDPHFLHLFSSSLIREVLFFSNLHLMFFFVKSKTGSGGLWAMECPEPRLVLFDSCRGSCQASWDLCQGLPAVLYVHKTVLSRINHIEISTSCSQNLRIPFRASHLQRLTDNIFQELKGLKTHKVPSNVEISSSFFLLGERSSTWRIKIYI